MYFQETGENRDRCHDTDSGFERFFFATYQETKRDHQPLKLSVRRSKPGPSWPHGALQMSARLRRGPWPLVALYLGGFRGGAVAGRGGRWLDFHRIQKRRRRRLRRTLVSSRTGANDLAVLILVTIRMNPFALYIIPAFP
jgi:hypothetical protein